MGSLLSRKSSHPVKSARGPPRNEKIQNANRLSRAENYMYYLVDDEVSKTITVNEMRDILDLQEEMLDIFYEQKQLIKLLKKYSEGKGRKKDNKIDRAKKLYDFIHSMCR